ncbi:uncharacterized protein LOC135485961 isoform X2 [Lineus longissimus]|uniref:uncharacterized protein LOC135485961 isoform X2 n=1 Tax=Lineus longissimus TaxID=88925 RepID=UPI002B4EE243
MASQVLTGELTFKSLPPLDLSVCTKEQIKEYFINSYELNDSLFATLKDDSVFLKYPDVLRLPLIFYYGHTAAVFVNKLVLAGLLEERINLNFETLFETGVDEMPWDDTENFRMGGTIDWPSVQEVYEYRCQVREKILELIDETTLELPIKFEDPFWALVMGFEHERIHVETSSVLIRQLPLDMVIKPEGFANTYAPATHGDGVEENRMVKVEGCDVTLGKPIDFPSYGWDNEYGKLDYSVPPFEATEFKVTNREFLKFVEAGCYEDKSLWSKEAWSWLAYKKAKHPTFWVCDEGCKSGCGRDLDGYTHCNLPKQDGDKKEFKLRLMFDLVDLPMDWPVVVNYHEAKAYCAWKGPEYRLPTEAEHHAMRGTMKPVSEGTSSDPIYQDDHDFNMNLRYFSSTPVNMFPPTDAGFYDVFGNVWEWIEDHFNGLPGFKSTYLYDDFSIPSMAGDHTLIMGSSWYTLGSYCSRFVRSYFRRHFFQFSGFRLCRSVMPLAVPMPVALIERQTWQNEEGVESPLDLEKYNIKRVKSSNTQFSEESYEYLLKTIESEYKADVVDVVEVIEECQQKIKEAGVSTERVIHLGCKTGRGSFELSKYFDKVLGIDFCGSYINACQKLQKKRTIRLNGLSADLPKGAKPSRVLFKQLTWLPNEVDNSEFVLLSCIDRALNPKSWTCRLKEMVKRNGLLAVTSADGWDETKLLHPDYLGLRFQVAFSPVELPSGTVITFYKHR